MRRVSHFRPPPTRHLSETPQWVNRSRAQRRDATLGEFPATKASELPRNRKDDATFLAGRGPSATTAVVLGVATGVTVLSGAAQGAIDRDAVDTRASEEMRGRAVERDSTGFIVSIDGVGLEYEEMGLSIDINSVTAPAVSLDVADASGMLPLMVTDSVGVGGRNKSLDVRAVQQRLHDLGFEISVDGQWGGETRKALKLFESMVSGTERIHRAGGKLTVNGSLHRALMAVDAPTWTTIPKSGVGFVNHDTDGHSHASSTLVDTLIRVGARYNADYLSSNPGNSRIATNDASLTHGGDTPDHSTHENGLDLDIRMPKNDGGSGSKVGWSSYDREAAFAMIKAFASDGQIERILTGDTVLLNRIHSGNYSWKAKVQNGGNSHKDHMHIDVKPERLNR